MERLTKKELKEILKNFYVTKTEIKEILKTFYVFRNITLPVFLEFYGYYESSENKIECGLTLLKKIKKFWIWLSIYGSFSLNKKIHMILWSKTRKERHNKFQRHLEFVFNKWFGDNLFNENK